MSVPAAAEIKLSKNLGSGFRRLLNAARSAVQKERGRPRILLDIEKPSGGADMGYPDLNGYFGPGLGSDLLGRPPNTIPTGLAAGLLQGLPGVVPRPGYGMGAPVGMNPGAQNFLRALQALPALSTPGLRPGLMAAGGGSGSPLPGQMPQAAGPGSAAGPMPAGLTGGLLHGLAGVTPAPGMVTEGNLPPVSAYPSGPAAQTPPDPNLIHQQRTIYGETAGIYPQLSAQTDDKGVYHPQNWDPTSADQLKTARAWMAGVRLVNHQTHESVPDMSNGVDKMVWGNSVDAAQAAQQLKPPAGTNHFFIRQDGQGPQGPGNKWTNPKLVKSFGPFINTGGGGTPSGSKTYIDFYKADD